MLKVLSNFLHKTDYLAAVETVEKKRLAIMYNISMEKNTDLKFPVSGFQGHCQRQTILQHLLWFGLCG